MWLSLCALGLAQGMRHAFEPDHLAAVSALASDNDKSAWRTVGFAALWGAGHASMLFLVGGLLYWQRAAMPEWLATAFELIVAVVLVLLGLRALLRAARLGSAAHRSDRAHDATPHVHIGGRSFALLPFGVGLLHGLAGSGALAALVMASQPELSTGLVLVAVYSIGTMFGMALLAGLLGAPLQRLTARPGAHRALLFVSGILSLVIGVMWGASVLSSDYSNTNNAPPTSSAVTTLGAPTTVSLVVQATAAPNPRR